jgi:hypothetical protein
MGEEKMREQGWLQKVFAEAGKRVDEWPEWKKDLEVKGGTVERAQVNSSRSSIDEHSKDK